MSALDSITAGEYMTAELITFTADMEVMTAINALVRHGVSGAPVLDEAGQIIGLLSEKDCLQVCLTAGYEGVPAGVVGEYMTRAVMTVTPETTLLEIASRFLDSPFKRFPVVQDGRLVGQISRSDVLRAINEHC